MVSSTSNYACWQVHYTKRPLARRSRKQLEALAASKASGKARIRAKPGTVESAKSYAVLHQQARLDKCRANKAIGKRRMPPRATHKRVALIFDKENMEN